MKKSILNVGTTLNRKEQKRINGGYDPETVPHIEMPEEPYDPIDWSPEDCVWPYLLNSYGRCVHYSYFFY